MPNVVEINFLFRYIFILHFFVYFLNKNNFFAEDAVYARTIYSVEFADNLWGLPQLIPTHPYLENSATLACLIRVSY